MSRYVVSNEKDKLLFQLTEEVGTTINQLNDYIEKLMQLPGLGVHKIHAEQLWNMRAKVTTLKGIQRGLVDIQNVENGKMTLIKNENSLRGIIIDAVSSIKHVADSNNVKIRTEIHDDVTCTCDKNKIERVIDNLIVNAIDFCPKNNAEIVVILKKNGDDVTINIVDNGIGIQKSTIDKIFDPDYQIKKVTERNHVEAALALPVCKAIIEKHGGTIWPESKGRDFGTTMHISLPMCMQEELRKLD